MPTVEITVTVAAPASAVVDVLLDAEAAPKWTEGLEQLELITGTIGEPGSVGRAHYVEGNRSYILEDRLISVTPNRRYVSEIAGNGLRARVQITLDEINGKTRITVNWSGSGTNPITWVILPFMKDRIARQAKADMAKLSELVEERWRTSRP